MSKPFKAPAKREVTIIKADDHTAANKFLTENVKTTINLFVASGIDIFQCLDMLENGLTQYCRMTHRQADLEMLERVKGLMESDEMEEEDDDLSEKYPATQPYDD